MKYLINNKDHQKIAKFIGDTDIEHKRLFNIGHKEVGDSSCVYYPNLSEAKGQLNHLNKTKHKDIPEFKIFQRRYYHNYETDTVALERAITYICGHFGYTFHLNYSYNCWRSYFKYNGNRINGDDYSKETAIGSMYDTVLRFIKE